MQCVFCTFSARHALELWANKSLISEDTPLPTENYNKGWWWNEDLMKEKKYSQRLKRHHLRSRLCKCTDPWPMKKEKMGDKPSIISILSCLTGLIFCSRSECQTAVKPQCFTVSQVTVDKDWAPERPARKSQSHWGRRVGVYRVSLRWQNLTFLMV